MVECKNREKHESFPTLTFFHIRYCNQKIKYNSCYLCSINDLQPSATIFIVYPASQFLHNFYTGHMHK